MGLFVVNKLVSDVDQFYSHDRLLYLYFHTIQEAFLFICSLNKRNKLCLIVEEFFESALLVILDIVYIKLINAL